ncbi:MAG: transcriptional regulator [Proteobacteria bacterium]|nr:transcriptional regulator [Pseudomonadota bacterium]
MEEEKAAFARRLRAALQDAGVEASAAVVEKRFNSRYSGTPVTVQAISGWLTGRYMPKLDKLRVLAEIARVDPQVLQFGGGGRIAEGRADWLPATLSARDKRVIDAYLNLTPKRRELVGELVTSLLDSGR